MTVLLATALLATTCGDDDSGGASSDTRTSLGTTEAEPTTASTSTSTTSTVTTTAPAFADASVTRNDDGTLTITWDLLGDGPVDIMWGIDGSTFDQSLGSVDAGGETTVADPAPGSRAYFRLRTGEDAITVAERRIALEGVPNFRDLGGYLTRDGRRVRWGQLFRSGALYDLTEADLAFVTGLGIKLVCDLRSDSEVTAEPDPDLGAEALRLAVTDESVDVQAITNAILAGDLDSLDPNLLRDGMPKIATEFNESWTRLIERISDPTSRPTNLHCTAGKDRGGFAAALILRALGVPEDVVMADYLLSNTFLEASNARTIAQVRTIVANVKQIPEDQVDMTNLIALLDVREEYLQAAFDAIDEQYGSFDAYLSDALGVTDDELAALRDSLLE